MALQKTIPIDNYGVSAEYWRITKIPQIDPLNIGAKVGLSGYITREHRNNSGDPLPGAWFEIDLPFNKVVEIMQKQVTKGNTVYQELATALYQAIKEHDFGGITDEQTGEYTPNYLFAEALDV